MKQAFLFLTLPLSAFSFAAGLWCVRRPRQVIFFQQRFYARINWRLEPLSWKKEQRNTILMGFFLMALSAATVVFLLTALLNGKNI